MRSVVSLEQLGPVVGSRRHEPMSGKDRLADLGQNEINEGARAIAVGALRKHSNRIVGRHIHGIRYRHTVDHETLLAGPQVSELSRGTLTTSQLPIGENMKSRHLSRGEVEHN